MSDHDRLLGRPEVEQRGNRRTGRRPAPRLGYRRRTGPNCRRREPLAKYDPPGRVPRGPAGRQLHADARGDRGDPRDVAARQRQEPPGVVGKRGGRGARAVPQLARCRLGGLRRLRAAPGRRAVPSQELTGQLRKGLRAHIGRSRRRNRVEGAWWRRVACPRRAIPREIPVPCAPEARTAA